jgi:glycosyltransferase involved in cell wall biosynthesis
MIGRPARVAVLASHPIQYFTPLYRRLAARPGLAIDVMYYRKFGVTPTFDRQFARTIEWDTDQLSGYSYRFLRNISPIRDTFNPLHAINPGAFVHLLRGYDAVWVNGYAYPSNWFALAAATLRDIPILFRSDMRLGLRGGAQWYDSIRDRIVRGWVQRANALLYVGTMNRDAYVAYGARPEQLFFAPYSVDVDVHRAAAGASPATKDAWRDELGLPRNVPIVLFAGKLTGRKHPEALIHACRIDAMRDRTLHLVFAGSGPEEGALRAAARETGMTNVSFLGFVNQSVLPRVYALADVFVLAAEGEPWGLALNEAMAAGAAPVVTTDVGAAADLIVEGETGYVVRPGDWDAVGARIARLLQDGELRRSVATAAMQRSSAYNFDATVDGIVSALAALGVQGAGGYESDAVRRRERAPSVGA